MVNPLKLPKATQFLAGGAVVAVIGLGTGGLAYAASSGHAPTLTPAHHPAVIKVIPAKPGIRLVPAKPQPIRVRPAGGCPTLTLVTGGQAPTVSGTASPTPVADTPVVCGAEGTTAG